jgi:hypothetical protein
VFREFVAGDWVRSFIFAVLRTRGVQSVVKRLLAKVCRCAGNLNLVSSFPNNAERILEIEWHGHCVKIC